MKFNKKGFTFAELMVSILIISIITAVLVPVVMEITPDNNKHLFRSAYKITETVISELINEQTTAGFELNGEVINLQKFCTSFSNKVNIVNQRQIRTNNVLSNCGTTPNCAQDAVYTAATCPNFTTTNGMRWYLSSNGTGVRIQVDVNGARKGENLAAVDPTIYNKSLDVFTINVENTGRIQITGANEMNYLSDSTDD